LSAITRNLVFKSTLAKISLNRKILLKNQLSFLTGFNATFAPLNGLRYDDRWRKSQSLGLPSI